MTDLDTFPAILPAISNRATFIRQRLGQINKAVGEYVLENAILLRELRENGYYREYGCKTFEALIEAMQEQGEIDYGARQARNFLAIAEMVEQGLLGEDKDQASARLNELGISKVREIANLPGGPEAKRALLDAASELTVSQVQAAAREQRDKYLGRDKDKLHPYTLMTTETQRAFLDECLELGRKLSGSPDGSSASGILIDVILADWRSGVSEPEEEEQPA